MRIDRASLEDLDVAVALLAHQFEEHGIALQSTDLAEAVKGHLVDERRGAVLVAGDPEPVGVAVLAYIWTLEHGGLVAWLEELYVVSARRGRGVGQALLERAVEVAREHGCRAVDLEVDVDHARAERLYRRNGFVGLPRRRWALSLTSRPARP
jgi:GNAT superfamily N-acetyltransferase